MGRRPRGTPLAQTGAFPSSSRAASPRSGDSTYRAEGDEAHGRGGSVPRRRHRTGPLSLPVPRRAGVPPGDLPRLSASRRRTRALAAGPDKRSIPYVETLAGDTTIGHTTAYCQLVEGLAGTPVSARALGLRAMALELERLANHTGGLGALANDVGFLPTASFCGRLRGDFLNLTAALCGSRFGRGLVRPGGTGFDADSRRLQEMLAKLEAAYRDTERAVQLLWDTASVQARFEDTGRVEPGVARQLGLVGVAGRACGLKRDVRKTHPSGYYRFVHIPISTWTTGDVFARAYVRWLEIERSTDFVRTLLHQLPEGPVRAPPGPLRGGGLARVAGRGLAGRDLSRGADRRPWAFRPPHCLPLTLC